MITSRLTDNLCNSSAAKTDLTPFIRVTVHNINIVNRQNVVNVCIYVCLTHSLPQPAKFPVSKVQTYTHANCIYGGPVTNIPSILCILIVVLSGAHTKGGKQALMISTLTLLLVAFRVTARQAWQ